MKASNKNYPLRAIAVGFLILLISSCKKTEYELPPAPKEIILEARVPSLIYSNIKEIYLDASSTRNLNGDRKLNFSWTCTLYPSGAPPPRIESPGNEFTKVDNLRPGEYSFLLTVLDLIGNKAEANFSLEVRKDTLLGVVPKVNAGPDQEITEPENMIILNGNETLKLNPINRNLNFRWYVIKQPAGSPIVFISNSKWLLTTASHLKEGIYQFQLEVSNELGIKGYDTLEVKVNPDPLRGLTRIFENQVWVILNYGDWDNYVAIQIADGGFFINRDVTNMEVKVWDEDKKDWADSGKYVWYVVGSELHILYPWSEDPAIYHKDVGKKTRVQVKIL